MKTEIKLERSLTPKDKITPNSSCVVLTPSTTNHNNKRRLKRGICGFSRHSTDTNTDPK